MMVELNGIKVSYECAGKGDNIVLMHGWGGSAHSFKPVFDYLSKHYKVYALDFPGFGSSDLPPEPWGAGDYGNCVTKIFKELAIPKTNIIAHSFGGRIAIWIAANFPGMVNKLVLVDSAGLKPKRTLKYHAKVTLAKVGKRILLSSVFGEYGENLLERFYKIVGSKDFQQQTGIMRATFVKIVNEDLRELLSGIIAPTLLVWGENDKEVPLSYAKIMEKEIKDAGLVVLEGAGHFSYLDKFFEFCLVISTFLRNKKVIQNHG